MPFLIISPASVPNTGWKQSQTWAELPLHGIHRTCFKDMSIWQSIHPFLCSQIRNLSNPSNPNNWTWDICPTGLLNHSKTRPFISEDSNIPLRSPQRPNTSLPFLLFSTLSEQVKGTNHPQPPPVFNKHLNNPQTRMQIWHGCSFFSTAPMSQQLQCRSQCCASNAARKRLQLVLTHTHTCRHSFFSRSNGYLLTSTTITFNIFSNTSLQRCSPTILCNNPLQRHFSTTLFPNSLLQLFSTTLFSNTSLQHSSPTVFSNTSLQHASLQYSSPTLLYHASLKHFSPTLSSTTVLCNTLHRHFSTTLFPNSLLQHFSPTLLCNTLLYHTSLQHSYPTLFSNTSLQLIYNTLLQQFSATTPFNDTSLQHSSPTVFSNSSLQRSSPTLLFNTLPQQSSPRLLYNTLLYNTLLQHFSTTLLSNTSLQHSPLQQFSAILLSNTSLQHSSLQYFSPTLFSTILLPNTSLQHPLQHFSATRFSKNLSSRRGTGPEFHFSLKHAYQKGKNCFQAYLILHISTVCFCVFISLFFFVAYACA